MKTTAGRLVLPLALLLVPSMSVDAQYDQPPLAALSANEIREAIAFGVKAKVPPGYDVKMKPGWGLPGEVWCGILTTPFTRVANEAYSAKRAYGVLTQADVKPEWLTPEFEIFAVGNPRQRADRVSAIVILQGGQVLKPTRFEPKSATYSNTFGRETEGTEATATFPLSVLVKDGEIRIVYSTWECRAPFRGGKIR